MTISQATLRTRAIQAPVLAAHEEAGLIRQAQTGDQEALESVILSHLRMALAEARRRSVVEVEDALQAAAEVMIGCVQRFDASLGVRFSTYARTFIASAVESQRSRGEMYVESAPPSETETVPSESVPSAGLSSQMRLLPALQQRVLALRFGLDGRAPRSQDRTAEVLWLSRRQVRRIEQEAITALRERLANVAH